MMQIASCIKPAFKYLCKTLKIGHFCTFIQSLLKPLSNLKYSKSPRIRTSTSKNLQSKIWGFSEMKIVSWAVFQCYSSRTCFDKLPLICTLPLHSMHAHLFTISVKNQARVKQKIVGSYSWDFTVLQATLKDPQ